MLLRFVWQPAGLLQTSRQDETQLLAQLHENNWTKTGCRKLIYALCMLQHYCGKVTFPDSYGLLKA